MKSIIITALIIIVTGCSSTPVNVAVLRIKGSDTMLYLNELLAAEYMKSHPGISIYVEGGGTAPGVKSLIRGEADISAASRTLEAEEAKALADYYGSLGLFYLIAKDALSIYVNPGNSVKNISLDQLRKIYKCEITNWKELGGNDGKIQLVIRNPNSGTHAYFREHVLSGDDYCVDAIIEPTTESVIEQIKNNENSIGYGGIGYGEDVTHLSIDGISPGEENARNDKYPITRYLHFFTTRVPGGAVKDFIDWVLSPEGQLIISKAGFIPLWKIST